MNTRQKLLKPSTPMLRWVAFQALRLIIIALALNWFRKDVVYVAEYFEKRTEQKVTATYKNPMTG